MLQKKLLKLFMKPYQSQRHNKKKNHPFLKLILFILFWGAVIFIGKNYINPKFLPQPLILGMKNNKLIDILNTKNIPAEKIDDESLYYRLYLPENIIVLLPKVNIEEKIAPLQLILKQFKIDGSKLNFIDLRFNKPVVK